MRPTLVSLIPRWRRRHGEDGEAGQSLVEFALALPILAFVLLGGVDLSRAFAIQVALQNAARTGAESAILGTASTDATIASYVRTEIQGTPGTNTSTSTVVISRTTEGSYCYVTVRVWYTFETLVPWPGIPTSARIDRTTRIRDFRPVPSGGDADNSEDSQDSQEDDGSGGSGQTNASNATDCDDSGGSDTVSGSQDESGGTPTEGTNTDDSEE